MRGGVSVDIRGRQLRQPSRLHRLHKPLRARQHQRCVSSRAPRFLTSVNKFVQKASMLCRVVVAGSDMD
jgi:hypothetical protein